MIDIQKTWENCLQDIEQQVSKANFNTWFKNTFICREDRGTVYIGVPNDFVKEWLQTKYSTIILRSLRNLSENIRSIEFIVTKTPNSRMLDKKIPLSSSQELPLRNLYINRKDNLNPRYQFDNFIIGPFNEIAYSASKAIIHQPGVYNPLFIYGSTGLGKTHLIQAVGNALKKNNNNLQVYYTSSENFTMELVNALRNNRIDSFKDKYRKYDVLIIDDIQFLSGKDKTQEELFHLFNIFYDKNKQIIFSSDKHPNLIIGLEERLKSRFSAGMIVDINKPEFESRVAILKAKASENQLTVDNDVMDYIASNVEGNIRELEGILNSLIVQIQLRGRNLQLREVKNLIKNNIKPKRTVSIKDIVKLISDFYNIEESLIYEKTRRKEIVHSRQVIMYLLREDYNISYPMIGKELGGRDHTTVIHSHLKIRNDIESTPTTSQEIEQLRAILST